LLHLINKKLTFAFNQEIKLMNLSIVIPVYNEEGNLSILYERLITVCEKITKEYEIIFVNDGSKDSSLSIIKEFAQKNSKIIFVNLSRNFGHQIAISAGLDLAIGKAIVIMDGDLQDPPELIKELYDKYEEGFEVVYAQRKKRKGDPVLKQFASKTFYKFFRKLTSVDMPIDTGDFRIIDRKILDILKNMPEKQKYLRGQIAWLGFKQTAVFFERDARLHGQSNYTYGKLIQLAWFGITGFSSIPLSFIVRLGLFVTFFSFLLIFYFTFQSIMFDSIISNGIIILICTSFFGGIQLLMIGIIAEYINNININVQNRPLYIIEETNKVN
jgi:dolichol-phosphate mannosyltransferase